ncbi:hypothetical protein HCC30_19615 [Streptomyces sp. HNM0574]|nr:hypothetical protein [Streptomyces sp. HNM0574]
MRARYELVGPALPEAAVALDRELPEGGAEAYHAARKRGVRSFGLWTDPHRRRLWARVLTARAEAGEPVRYEVYGAEGEFVGGAVRERSFTRGHVRTRWTVEQADGTRAVGYKGRWFWWCVWWLIFPVQCVLAVLSLAGGGDVFRMPRRIGYRTGGARVLDYGSGLQPHFHLTASTPDWDPRLLAALTALHCSHDGIMGEPWDKGDRESTEPEVPSVPV